MDDDIDIGAVMMGLAVILVIGTVIALWAVSIGAITAPWAEQIRTDTRQQSESYLEGTLSDFQELCLKLDTAPEHQRSTYANVIFQRSGRVTDEVLAKMPNDTQRCIRDARDLMRGQIK